jgi:hypothetical protein
MRKVVINAKHGGFGLSDEAVEMYGKLKGLNLKKCEAAKYSFFKWNFYIDGIEDDEHYFMYDDIERDDPFLVETVEKLGEKSSGSCAKLKIVEIPNDVEFSIEEYDGLEHIAEKHRTWY